MPPRPSRSARAPARPPRAAGRPALAPPPPLLRDPWAAGVALAVLPLLAVTRGARPGEPFADDFLFLDFSVLRHVPSWWSGGGGAAYWRPLARQAYFAALGPLALAHPLALAALHALALAAAAVLAYRALRTVWPAPAAALAGAFPLGLESARVLVAWPSGAQDLGALAFLALALHAAARGRRGRVAVAGVAAALCKEVAAPLALLAALAPFPRRAGSAWRAALPTTVALAAWAIVRFAFPHGGGAGLDTLAGPAAAGSPLAARALAALGRAARDAFGLAPGLPGGPLLGAGALACAGLSLARLAGARARAAGLWRWSAWGLAWFAAGALPLALFLPDWAPFRSVLPALGLGVALAAPLARDAPAWLAPLLAVRLVALGLAPQPPARLVIDVGTTGDALAYPRLALLQRSVADVRRVLARVAPALPPRATVARQAFPRMTGVAFAGDRSLQAWYRDTTLRWATTGELREGQYEDARAMIEFEPTRTPQWTSVDVAAMRAYVRGVRALRAGRTLEGLGLVDSAEAALRDTSAAQFLAALCSWRAMAEFDLGRYDAAEADAGRSLGHFIGDYDARFVLARVWAMRGQWRAVSALLDEQLRLYPQDVDARRFRDQAEARLAPPAR